MNWRVLCFVLLVVNTFAASWSAGRRYIRVSELDRTVIGTVITAETGSGRTPDRLLVRYEVGGRSHTVEDNASTDSSLTVKNHPLGSTLPVYTSSEDPSIAALTPAPGYFLLFAVAVLLFVATGVFGYLALFKRRRGAAA